MVQGKVPGRERKVRATCCLSRPVKAGLELMAIRARRPLSDYMRLVITDWVERHEKETDLKAWGELGVLPDDGKGIRKWDANQVTPNR
jgi:hypothetical protein